MKWYVRTVVPPIQKFLKCLVAGKFKLVIWYLSDGKPGHLNQILGLISALEELTSIDAYEIPVENLTVSYFGWLTGKVALPENLQADEMKSPDIIIGAGHGTHKALLALSRKTSAKSLLLMSPSLPLAMFNYVCAPDHDRLPYRKNCLSTEGALNRMKPAAKEPSSGLLLIGGPSSHAKWRTNQIISQINHLVEVTKNTNWTLTTSRRTPEDFIEEILQKPNLKIINWQQTDKNWLPEKMSTTEEIWVTPDSVSMIYEAITAQAKVGIFELKILPTRVSMGIENLTYDKRILNFNDWKDGHQWRENSRQLNEAHRCAVWLLKRMEQSK